MDRFFEVGKMLKDNDKKIIIDLGFLPGKIHQLEKYIDLLWTSNEELNLISRKMTSEELIQNHIIDCLLPLKLFPQKLKKVADLGTGGGLPALIYAIQFPDIQFDLYEKSPLKRQFLEKCKATVASNIYIYGEVPKDLPSVDLVTARGFKPIDVILQMTSGYFQNGGKYFLLKARMEKINEELRDAKKKFKTVKENVTPLKSPVLDVERHLVIV